MFCPNCKGEFKKDISHCPDCGVLLVEALSDGVPSEPEPGAVVPAQEMVAVFSTANSAVIPVVSSVLEAAGIPHLLQGEHGMAIEPAAGTTGEAVSAGSVVVLVPTDRAREARSLVKEYEQGQNDL